MSWEFLTRRAVEAFHAEQLRRHGGAQGLRDENALESALARAENKVAYGEPTVHELAAAYVFGIARNHAFVDGNKRTAAVVGETFLALNGHALAATDAELVVAILALAAGELAEDELADWFRSHVVAG